MRIRALTLMEVLAGLCLGLAFWFGLTGYMHSGRFPSPENRGNVLWTPEHQRWEKAVEAQLATRPTSTYPAFIGKAYEPRPLLSIRSTYLALAFAALGVILFVIQLRQGYRAQKSASTIDNLSPGDGH